MSQVGVLIKFSIPIFLLIDFIHSDRRSFVILRENSGSLSNLKFPTLSKFNKMFIGLNSYKS